MGIKRTFKNLTKRCELCGKKFDSNKDKFIYRIDKNGRCTVYNILVVCGGCHDVDFHDITLEKDNFDYIGRYLGVKGKIYRTKRKYENK